MTNKQAAVLQVAQAIGQLARALHALSAFPTSEHQQFSALLSNPATQEKFCLPSPSEARVVCIKHLRATARDWPGIAPAIGEIIATLSPSE